MKKNRRKIYKKAQNIIKNNLPKNTPKHQLTQEGAKAFVKGYYKIISKIESCQK